MKLEFDPVKSAKNAKERGLSFNLAIELDWGKAVISVDDRFMYGEERLTAYVPMRGRLYVVCYVLRGETRRIISFRKANKREVRRYAEATANQ